MLKNVEFLNWEVKHCYAITLGDWDEIWSLPATALTCRWHCACLPPCPTPHPSHSQPTVTDLIGAAHISKPDLIGGGQTGSIVPHQHFWVDACIFSPPCCQWLRLQYILLCQIQPNLVFSCIGDSATQFSASCQTAYWQLPWGRRFIAGDHWPLPSVAGTEIHE